MSALRTGLLGKKIGMTQVFNERGDLRPVTAVLAGNNVVVGKRTVDKDGYSAVRIGFLPKAHRLVNKPQMGIFAKAGVDPHKVIKEFRVSPADLEKFEVGKAVPLDVVFKANTYVDVSGQTKGKGYQGVVKRHHMGGNRASHGTHEFFRHGGSIGCRLTPGRVHRGKRMSGHMGAVKRTVQNIAIVDILADQGVILLGGSVPGGKNGFVVLRNSTKKTGAVKMRGGGELQEKSKNPMKASKAAAAAKKK